MTTRYEGGAFGRLPHCADCGEEVESHELCVDDDELRCGDCWAVRQIEAQRAEEVCDDRPL